MLNPFDFLISSAWAADAITPAADAVAAPGSESMLMRFMPFILILIVFYFFVIRPQQKKTEEHMQMLAKLKKGDKVVTSAGLVGTVAKVDGDQYILLEIAKGVEIKVVKSSVTGPVDEAVPANQNK